MYAQYHPLGIVGTISAFNFPVAVWSWNAMIAAVCGDTNIWKPSSKVPLTAIAVQNILEPVIRKNELPEGLFSLIVGRGSSVGEKLLMMKDYLLYQLLVQRGLVVMVERLLPVVLERQFSNLVETMQ